MYTVVLEAHIGRSIQRGLSGPVVISGTHIAKTVGELEAKPG